MATNDQPFYYSASASTHLTYLASPQFSFLASQGSHRSSSAGPSRWYAAFNLSQRARDRPYSSGWVGRRGDWRGATAPSLSWRPSGHTSAGSRQTRAGPSRNEACGSVHSHAARCQMCLVCNWHRGRHCWSECSHLCPFHRQLSLARALLYTAANNKHYNQLSFGKLVV